MGLGEGGKIKFKLEGLNLGSAPGEFANELRQRLVESDKSGRYNHGPSDSANQIREVFHTILNDESKSQTRTVGKKFCDRVRRGRCGLGFPSAIQSSLAALSTNCGSCRLYSDTSAESLEPICLRSKQQSP